MIPTHLAVIGDGNRRWARANGRPDREGHLAAVDALDRLVTAWRASEIPFLTFWWSSADNLRRRDPVELDTLFEAHRTFFDRFAAPDVELRAYGRWRDLCPPAVIASVDAAITRSRPGAGKVLSFLLGYNGDEEMLQLIERIRADDPKKPVDEALVREHLPTGDLPPVDLVVRTGGDPHLSTGFMMWQTRYAQLWFTDTLWPAFDAAELGRALASYAAAPRKLGR
jgi:undecaprenyl diphosphate synthase